MEQSIPHGCNVRQINLMPYNNRCNMSSPAPCGIESNTISADKDVFTRLPASLKDSMPLACEGGLSPIIGLLTKKLWYHHVY
jgi:hypothetical protein